MAGCGACAVPVRRGELFGACSWFTDRWPLRSRGAPGVAVARAVRVGGALRWSAGTRFGLGAYYERTVHDATSSTSSAPPGFVAPQSLLEPEAQTGTASFVPVSLLEDAWLPYRG